MGTRQWQVFIAPETSIDYLPIKKSPWHLGRQVRLPREHWKLIIDFSKQFDLNLGHLLDECSNVKFLSTNKDEVLLSDETLNTLLLFIKEIQLEILKADELVPGPTEELPDDYTNAEYAKMLEAVGCVFEEAKKLKKAVRAWVDGR